MKNKIFKISVFAVLISLLLSVSVFAQTELYVYDPVYLLDDNQYAQLNQQAAEISQKYQCAVHFVVDDNPAINVNNIQQYAEDLYLESSALGYGSGKDGVMLVLGTYDRCYWLLAYGEKGNYAFTDYAKDMMTDNFLDNFSYDDWYGGFSDYLNDCEYILSEAANGRPVDIYYSEANMGVEAYGVAFIFAVIVAFAVCSFFKAQMKTAVIATNAANYVDKGNVNIMARHQHFTHSTVTRTKIESNHSSGPRGGTTVNSRGFSGKGGRF